MRKYLVFILLTLVGLVSSCKNDSTNTGRDILDFGDSIIVKTDTFNLLSSLRLSPDVLSAPDSMLVGEIETSYGTMRATALTQFSCPLGFVYPETTEIDSICLFLYYTSWVGDGKTPLALTVNEIDGEVMPYNTPKDDPYLTSFDLSRYCSMSAATNIVESQRIIVASEKTDSIYSSDANEYVSVIQFKMTKAFCDRFATLSNYKTKSDGKSFTQKDFNEFFKGVVISSNFGSSTLLNIRDINMGVYYKFSYNRLGKDTTVTDTKSYYSNAEVRQLNHFEYSETDELIERLNSQDTCYIIAPAGVYTSLKLPMGVMKYNIVSQLDGKRPYVNMAEIRVDVIPVEEKGRDQWLQPAQEMLLIRDNNIDRIEKFFLNKESLSDTLAILSSLKTGQDSVGNDVNYYSFDISTLLTQQLRQEGEANLSDTLQMTFVPVNVEYSSSSNGTTTISNIKQAQTPSATLIRSAHSDANRMSLKVVYSGF